MPSDSVPPPYAPYQPYQPYPPYSQFPPPEPATNVLAIVGFITSFFVGLAGIICGHIALSQIRRTGEKGRGLALAATIIGYAQVGLMFLWIAAASIIVLFSGVAQVMSASSDAPVAPNAACSTVESAAQNFSTALTSLESSDWRSAPADAKAKLIAEWSTFDGKVSSIEDPAISAAINTADDDLNDLNTALVDYEAAAPGQGDAATITAAFAKAEDGLNALASSCR